jgi:DNA-binding MurR/RpiR family transcriptional regulator
MRGPAEPGSLDERLIARRDALSPVGRRVADFFAQHREEVAFLSAAEMAQQIGTSDATVVRTAQSLGYAGLQELKHELAATLRARAMPTVSPEGKPSIGEHDPASTLDGAISEQIALLEATRDLVTSESLARALEILSAARRIFILGAGLSATAAEYFALRLVRLGREARASTHTGIHLAEDVIGMRAGDTLVALGTGHVTRELAVALEYARERDIPVVALTETPGDALADRVTVMLQTPPVDPDMGSGTATAIVLIDALVAALTVRAGASARATQVALDDVRAKLAGDLLQAEKEQ